MAPRTSAALELASVQTLKARLGGCRENPSLAGRDDDTGLGDEAGAGDDAGPDDDDLLAWPDDDDLLFLFMVLDEHQCEVF